jgi:hypothetical protein
LLFKCISFSFNHSLEGLLAVAGERMTYMSARGMRLPMTSAQVNISSIANLHSRINSLSSISTFESLPVANSKASKANRKLLIRMNTGDAPAIRPVKIITALRRRRKNLRSDSNSAVYYAD